MAEIAFETLLLALESTRGTAIAAPTHLLSLDGFFTPEQTFYRPLERRGTLIRNYRSVVTRKGATWTAKGDADTNILPVLMNMITKPVTSPSTPGGATLPRLWTFLQSITSDDLKTGTLWWGDPNVQVYRAAFACIDEMTFKNDAGEASVAQISVKGRCKFPGAVADPSVPAAINNEGGLMPGAYMQLWLDTSSAIGTTAITGRLLSAEHTFKTGFTYKYLAAGTSSDLGYNSLGREPTSVKSKLVFELTDTTQYDNYAAADTIKMRIRHNGAQIEGSYYHYFELDQYGPFDMLTWGTYAGSNRTVELTIDSEYDTTLANDHAVRIENARASL